jgi:hypothetical protein
MNTRNRRFSWEFQIPIFYYERRLVMTIPITQAPATEGQKKHLVRLIQDALPDTKCIEELVESFCSESYNAQLLIEGGDELKVVRRYLANEVKRLSDPNLYADQVVTSKYGYLSGYRKACPMDEQIALLRQYDWGRDVDWSLNEVQQKLLAGPVPQGSEGYFAVVFDQTMVTHYEEDPNIDQSVPVTRVLEALYKQRNGRVVNYRNNELDRTHYRRSKKSAEKMRKLWESQGSPSGILLIPAQLGIEHAGKSVLRARVVIRGSEFPLDAYEVLQIVLTHENRLQHYDDPWISLPGSEYSPGADGVFGCALCVEFHGGFLKFDYDDVGNSYGRSGSASGFLPQ